MDPSMLDLLPSSRALMRSLVVLLFSQCNAFVVNDVLTCLASLALSRLGLFYLESWLECIRSRCVARVLKLRPISSITEVRACPPVSPRLPSS